jgi:uncharacterized protein YdhG (YjbR/CyaY superfamily)
MRYTSKEHLLADIRKEHDALVARIGTIAAPRLREPGVWGDGWSVADLVAHLAEWQFMFLAWHEQGLQGAKPPLPAPGYKWNQLAALNRAIWAKHRTRSLRSIQSDFQSGYAAIVSLVERLSPAELLQPGHFGWTGRCSLTTYIGANTSSHYRFAMNVLKRWQKGTTRPVPAELKRSGRPGARSSSTRGRPTVAATANRDPQGTSMKRSPAPNDAAQFERLREYLASRSVVARSALRKLRDAIRAAAPGVTDAFSYGIPAMRFDGRILVWYAAWKRHCSLYPMTADIRRRHSRDLERYTVSKGTVRFPLDEPVPVALVKRLVRTRVAELRAKSRRVRKPARGATGGSKQAAARSRRTPGPARTTTRQASPNPRKEV